MIMLYIYYRRWSEINQFKQRKLRKKKQNKTKNDMNPLGKLNHTRKVKVRRKKIKNRQKNENKKFKTTTEIIDTITSVLNDDGIENEKIQEKFQENSFNSTRKLTEITNEIGPQQMMKKRKSHKNGKKRKKLVSLHQQLPNESTTIQMNRIKNISLPEDASNPMLMKEDTPQMMTVEVNANSLNHENHLNQVDRQEQNYDWDSGMQISQKKENTSYNVNGDDSEKHKSDKTILLKENRRRQKLVTKEEKLKVLQAKRELKRKQKLERIAKRKRKGKNKKDAITYEGE